MLNSFNGAYGTLTPLWSVVLCILRLLHQYACLGCLLHQILRAVNSFIHLSLFVCVARESSTGKLINDYLEQKSELDDHVIHLLFSANRWEAVWVAHQIPDLYSEFTTLFYSNHCTMSDCAKYIIKHCLLPDVVDFTAKMCPQLLDSLLFQTILVK